MRRHSVTPAVPAVLVAAALLGAGCGSQSVDTTQVEAGIKANLSTSGAKVDSVNCPSDVKKQKGDTFTCDVSFSNGASGKAVVTQEGGNKYSYALKSGSVQIPGSTVEAEISKQLAAQGAPNATVTCPSTIIVKVGTTVTCDVSGAGGAAGGTVTFTFSSAEGTIDDSSVKTTS